MLTEKNRIVDLLFRFLNSNNKDRNYAEHMHDFQLRNHGTQKCGESGNFLPTCCFHVLQQLRKQSTGMDSL